jgi:hypothetical protein
VSIEPEWEYERLVIPRDVSRGAARRLLAERAERGQWVLAWVRRAPDGTRRVLLRRRVVRVRRTA